MSDFQIIPPPGNVPVLSDNAMKILQSRYLIKDEQGKCIETPAQLFSRVASVVAEAEAKYGAKRDEIRQWHRKFYNLMAQLLFLPNSPALMNAGRTGTLSACFVLPIEDSTEAIFETVKRAALIQKAGGGTGFSFDKLRPTGDRIATGSGTTSGPISFWRVFCDTTDALQQETYNRGANIGMMSVEHPDILKFLHAKQNLKAFTNFNTSVKIPDDWMGRLLKSGNAPHIVKNPRTQEFYLIPRKINIDTYTISDLYQLTASRKSKPAGIRQFYTVGDIWKTIVKCAHKTGEPGLVFIDRINRDNPTPLLGRIEATNPCGEQPLLAYEACTLGSINLAKFVTYSDGKADLDWPKLADTIKSAVRFLDDIIDVCDYPVLDTVRLAQSNRKIGLGVMGFADCLFLLGVPYDSQQGVEFGANVMKFINETARQASNELAYLRGPFPNWINSIWRTEKNIKVRNASITCVAPTGTTSIIADCSCGIEPIYSLVFIRRLLGEGSRKPVLSRVEGAGSHSKMLQVNPVFRQVAEREGLYNKKLERKIARTGSAQKIASIPVRIRRIFKCAYDIKPEWHIRMQAAFQQNCDAAVSKTINFSEKASPSDVDKAYKLAYQLGCKGITVYRQKSRAHEPMSLY
jgi:ribonucleoside-diphosphate reductase alpha chain